MEPAARQAVRDSPTTKAESQHLISRDHAVLRGRERRKALLATWSTWCRCGMHYVDQVHRGR